MEIFDLPFNQFIGIARSELKDGMLSLPNDVRYTNHLGTVHAGALLALAEATSGDFLIRELRGVGFEVLPVVRRTEAKFRKPAFGSVYSKVHVAPENKDEFLATLTAKSRALLRISVDVYDESDTHVLAAIFEWFVSRNK